MKIFSSKKGTRTLMFISTILVLSLVLAGPALAGENITDETVARVAEGEVIDDDLFISGQTVEMLGTVKGDVFAAGQNVIVRGVIEGNLFAAGQVVVVGGEVENSAYLAGYVAQLEPTAVIAKNIYFGGFSLASDSDSQIDRSLYFGGYQMLLDGDVGRDVSASGGAVKVNGMIGGDAQIYVEKPAEEGMPAGYTQPWGPAMPVGISIPIVAPGADVPEENVAGKYDVQVSISQTPVAPEEVKPEAAIAAKLLNKLRQRAGELVALVLVGSLVVAFTSGCLDKAVDQVRNKWLNSLGWGVLVYLLLIPVILVVIFLIILAVLLLSFITLGSLTSIAMMLGGLGLSGLLAAFSVIAGLLAKILVAYLVGHELLKRTSPATLEGRWGKFWALLIGVVLYELILLIPVGGMLVCIFVVLLGVGAIFALLWEAYKGWRAAAA